MKEIILKELELKNFKGIKDLKINFDKITNIFGDNATGKTTIFDAFTWLLFDKDSQDRKDFEIKTLDKNNNVINMLEHEVTAVIEIDKVEKKISKIYKEKWTKKRGEAEKQLTGHTTDYYIDDVPIKKGEFSSAINEIIDEKLFKLITNPLYFSTSLNWKERREVLLSIIGDIEPEKVVNYNKKIQDFLNILGDKKVEEFKKMITAKKKKLNDDLKAIPYRVDELNNSKKEFNFVEIEEMIKRYEAEKEELEQRLFSSTKINKEFVEKQNELYSFKNKLKDLEFKAEMKANDPKKALEKKLYELNNKIASGDRENMFLEREISSLETQKEVINSSIESLRINWFDENSKVLEFNEHEFNCPTCKRKFEEADIESKKQEMTENFNINKAEKLKKINLEGSKKKNKLSEIEKELKEKTLRLTGLKADLEQLKEEGSQLKNDINNFIPKVELDSEYEEIKNKINELESKSNNDNSTESLVNELMKNKRELQEKIDSEKSKLAYRESNGSVEKRIKELLEDEKEIAQRIAEIEKQEYQCEIFIKTKVELMEESINNKFKFVRFKLFNTLVNGAIEECCECTVEGVPFQSVNNAAKINAGIDIINTLCNHYEVEAPIFVDNAESVNELIESYSQVIRLVVSNDKTLKVGA